MARKILLADDSVTAQNMGRKILSDAGYDVVTVNNGSAALKRVAEHKPDLIVLDVYMPGYSGLEVCQRLKDSSDTDQIPVLLTVGKLEPFKPEEARRVRADAYIIKPFEASELLTALARMEDRMVPGKGDGSRFSDGGSKRSESEGDPDTGWKNRLRFPSKKKKEEPESEPEMDFEAGPSFRNFRRGKGKAQASSAASEKTAPAAVPAPAGVPDIPRDITPEELDALSALAAKLDGPAPTLEEKVTAAEVEKSSPVEAKPEFEVAAPAGKEMSAGEVPATHEEPQGERETPVTNAFPAASAAVIAEEPAAVSEVKPTETVHVKTLAAEPAPVDREDEPAFATASSAVEPAAQQEKIETKEVPADTSEAAAVNPPETIPIQATAEEQKPEKPKVDEGSLVAETAKAEASPTAEGAPRIEAAPKTEELGEAVPAAKAAQEPEVGPAPTEEELAEALRLLTPALGHGDPSAMPTRETLVAAGAMLAEEAARNASAAPRWMAAAVAVSSEEAAVSLEAEMFRTLAGPPAAVADSGTMVATVAVTPAAESGAAAGLNSEKPAEAPAETMAAVPAVASEAAALSVEAKPAGEKDSSAPVAEEAAEEPAATFADAVQHDEVEGVSAKPGAEPVFDASVPVSEVGPAVVGTMEVSTSEAAGGEDDMSKDRGKNGKSNWHQIRTGSAAAGTHDAVEAAKQAEPAEEAPKAMAAAAAAESGAASAASSDPNAIASIVDSVLADLRPKIVEEIAKKLAKRD